jgi:hypothetical protein
MKTASVAWLEAKELLLLKRNYHKAKSQVWRDLVEILENLTVDVTSWSRNIIYPVEKSKARVKLCNLGGAGGSKNNTEAKNNHQMDLELDNTKKDDVIITLDRNWELGRILANSLEHFFNILLQGAKKFGPTQP